MSRRSVLPLHHALLRPVLSRHCAKQKPQQRRQAHIMHRRCQTTKAPSSVHDIPGETKRVVTLLSIGQFMNNAGFACSIPVLPIFAAEMGLGPAGVGLILSMSSAGRLVANIPASRLTDHWGRRPLIISGPLICAAASFGTAMSYEVISLLLCRAALGCGSACSNAALAACTADVTQTVPEHRGKIMAFQGTFLNAAYAAGPALGGVLADIYGVRASFYAVGVGCMLGSVTFMRLRETKPTTSAIEPRGQQESDGNAWEVYKTLLRNPNQQGLMTMQFALSSSYSACLTVLPLHALNIMGEAGSTTHVGLLFGTLSAVGFVAAPAGGWLADRIGRKAALIPAVSCICLGVVSTTFTSMVHSFETLLPCMLIWGVGNSLTFPILGAYAVDIATDESTRSQALSLSRQAGDAAFLVMPLGLGALAQLSTNSVALQCCAGGIFLAHAVFAVRAGERHVVR